MDKKYLMKCGHTANSIRESDGKPVCVICAGMVEGYDEIAEEQPDLTGRMARCSACRKAQTPSRLNLPFFEHLPKEEFDTYYCGCWGWN